MNIRKRMYWCYSSVIVFLSLVFSQGCVEENIEEKFLGESVAAKEHFLTNVLPVLNSKCFSCHTYHTSSGTRYDTHVKAAAVAEEMAKRITSTNPAIVMPPPSAAPLTEEEKQAIQQFVQLVKGAEGSSLDTEGEEDSQDYGVSISWTAYKFPDFQNRVGVTGTFDEAFVTYKQKEAADIYEFLTEAEILIPTNSTNIGNDALKTANVINHFFSFFTPVIHGQVMDIDPPSKKAKVKITINGLSQEVLFDMEEVADDLVFTGKIEDIGYFNAQTALDALQRVCGEYHQDKVWPDLSLKAEIKNFRKFSESPH